jgi:cell division protein FtsA
VSRDRRLVAGLDLGSTKTCAVIAEVTGEWPREPLAKVLGVGLAKNGGVRRGMVRDIEETATSVKAALRDAQRMAGVKISEVTCGIAGEHVSARTEHGVVAVNGDEITPTWRAPTKWRSRCRWGGTGSCCTASRRSTRSTARARSVTRSG